MSASGREPETALGYTVGYIDKGSAEMKGPAEAEAYAYRYLPLLAGPEPVSGRIPPPQIRLHRVHHFEQIALHGGSTPMHSHLPIRGHGTSRQPSRSVARLLGCLIVAASVSAASPTLAQSLPTLQELQDVLSSYCIANNDQGCLEAVQYAIDVANQYAQRGGAQAAAQTGSLVGAVINAFPALGGQIWAMVSASGNESLAQGVAATANQPNINGLPSLGAPANTQIQTPGRDM